MSRTFPAQHVAPDRPGFRQALRAWRRPLIAAAFALAALVAWGLWGGFTGTMNGLASRALAKRDLLAAERWLTWSKRLHCNDGRTQLLEARLTRRQNRFEEMRRHLEEARRLGVAVELLEREQWLALAQAGQMREAGPNLKRLLLDPRGDETEICEAYAMGYLWTYQIDRVEAILSAWTRDFPQDHLPYLIRARLFVRARAWKDAESSYRRTLELAPGCDEAMRGLGDVLVTQQRPDEALKWYLRVPQLSLHSADARIGAADCLVTLGRASEARQLLSGLLETHPGNPLVLRAVGRLELEAGNCGTAADLLGKAHTLQPESDETLFALVAALRGLGENDKARSVLDLAERTRAANEAISRLQDIVVHDPENVEARYQIGKDLLSIGSQKDALIWLRSVLQFDPGHTAAREAISANSH